MRRWIAVVVGLGSIAAWVVVGGSGERPLAPPRLIEVPPLPAPIGSRAVHVPVATVREAEVAGAPAEGPAPALPSAVGEPVAESVDPGELEVEDPRREAIGRALEWLGRVQGADGAWSAGPGADVGATSLALLAFVDGGHTHRFGTHKKVVRRALKWLRGRQRGEGSGPDEGLIGDGVAEHAWGLLALAETYAISRDFVLRKPIERAVAWALAAQGPHGGWSDRARPGLSEHTTSWMLIALRAARAAGVEVAPDALERGAGWLARAPDAPCARPLMRLARWWSAAVAQRRALRAELARDPVAVLSACEAFARSSLAYEAGGDLWRELPGALQPLLLGQAVDGSFLGNAGCLPAGAVASTALTAHALTGAGRCRCFHIEDE